MASSTKLLVFGGTILAGSLSLYLLRRYLAGGVCHSKAKLNGKTVIITGANTGIGKETAIDLARRGARVIMACRSAEKGEEAVVEVRGKSGNDRVVFRRLDLASLESVRRFASTVLEEEQTIDILINNAGGFYRSHLKTVDGFEMHFGVNYLGHFLLTNLLLDRLKEAPTARIVNVSAAVHAYVDGINFDDLNSEKSYSSVIAVAQSKLATILFTRSLAEHLAGSNVIANCLHPGLVRTEVFRHVGSGLLMKILHFLLIPFKSPREGAQTLIYCAVDEAVEGISGKYFRDCKVVQPSKAAVDDNMAERLWRVSAELVEL